MRIFKTKRFHKWASNEGLSDEVLSIAVDEMEHGLIDANLGGNVYKKRISLQDRGKRSGVRTLLAFKQEECTFFMYGFAKNERSNIKDDELKALKAYARELLGYSDRALNKALQAKKLFEVINDGE
ncbi:MAG: type II toxin-antitoxin system RelE/ParE family toxin [Proteobacteria bacterium]|nr:type II toxin-antitoxin system RelE/ParE family toxin [Pseudomonadota bacterium]NOG59264.1 type II toxin-antitoxin system RelE/ParE family toxin [Pseudomonadota bacterium]